MIHSHVVDYAVVLCSRYFPNNVFVVVVDDDDDVVVDRDVVFVVV